MRMIFKVSFYVRSNYENKNGKSPLMIRIYLNREMLNVGSSGLNVDKKLWCNATSRMKGRSQEALSINTPGVSLCKLAIFFRKQTFRRKNFLIATLNPQKFNNYFCILFFGKKTHGHK